MRPILRSINSTWRWATFSNGSIGRLATVLLPVLLLAAPAAAKVFLTLDKALELAFPGCKISDHTIYLSESQLAKARELSGCKIESALVRQYVARKEGQVVGTAYFDTHRVRTLSELLMIAVDPTGKVLRLEVLSFNEPEDYIPRDVWYDQLEDRRLSGDLELGRGVDAVTGATLTARATTQAVRRVLAIHQVLQESDSP